MTDENTIEVRAGFIYNGLVWLKADSIVDIGMSYDRKYATARTKHGGEFEFRATPDQIIDAIERAKEQR